METVTGENLKLLGILKNPYDLKCKTRKQLKCMGKGDYVMPLESYLVLSVQS